MKVTITLGGNSFEADGDFLFDEGFTDALRSWINAQGGEGGKVEDMTARLRGANDRQAAAVTANTPTTT